MSRGHSCRGGRSRCTAKVGPSSRAHKKRSVVRAEAIRAGEDATVGRNLQQLPNLRNAASPYTHAPARPVTEPTVTVRHLGSRTVEIVDFSGGAT